MKHRLFLYLTVLFTSIMALNIQAQSFEQITVDLKAGDVVVFREVMTEYAMSNGSRANLVAFDPNASNIQFIVEGNPDEGYQFLVKATSDGIAGSYGSDESYLSGGSTAWDVLIKAYDASNCTWQIVPVEGEEGIYMIKNSAEAGDNYIGVNYGDAGAGYPLWRDKAGFPYSELNESSTYGVFFKIYKSSMKNELEHWMNIAFEKFEEFGRTANGAQEMIDAINEAELEYESPESTKETVDQAVIDLKAALFEFLVANASAKDPMDITFHAVKNADMEGGTATPWVNATNISDFHTEPVHVNITGFLTGNFLQTWNNTADAAIGRTGRVYQTISGLPNGVYSLEAGYTEMWEGQEEEAVIETGTNIYLYGNTQRTELTVDKLTVFGFPKTGGRLAAVDDIRVTDGTLEIGVLYEGGHMTVSALDNVVLYYKGFDLTSMVEALESQLTTAKEELVGEKMQATVSGQLDKAIEGVEKVIVDPAVTKEELEFAGSELGAVVKLAGASIDAYAQLKKAVDAATEFYVAIEVGDASKIIQAIANAQAQYDEATVNEAAIEETVDGLGAVVWNFQVENASEGQPLDMTKLVKNADMETSSPLSWVNETNISDFHTEPVNVNITGFLTGYFLQTWNSTADAAIGKTGRVYQTITGLPHGYYTLTAAYTEMWEGQEEDLVIETETGIYLYGNAEQTELVIDKLSRFGFPETGGRVATVDNILVNDGTLEIGVSYQEAHMTVSALDNVVLSYKGGLTDIKSVSADKEVPALDIFQVEGGVIVVSPKACNAGIYTVNGQLVRIQTLAEGDNYVSLPSGRYILGNQLCIVK